MRLIDHAAAILASLLVAAASGCELEDAIAGPRDRIGLQADAPGAAGGRDALTAGPRDCVTCPSPGEDPNTPPSAGFQWRVEKHYEASWAAYDPASRSYDLDELFDPSRRVTLDACLVVSRLFNYEWSVVRITDGRTMLSRTGGCRQTVDLTSNERYRVHLTVRRKGDGATARRSQNITPYDRLIVSIGDSNASGEGNIMPGSPAWYDEPCHRSKTSGHAIAAQMLEDRDPHSSVTFVSVACSAARIRDLYARSQRGQGSQIEQLERIVGRRHIDALFVSVGINDLRFSRKLLICATNPLPSGCIRDFSVQATEELDVLRSRFAELADRLGRLDVGEVYISEYPVRLFTDDDKDDVEVCGVFSDPGLFDLSLGSIGGRVLAGPLRDVAALFRASGAFEIDESEARWLHNMGDALNRAIAGAAGRHGWNYIGGIVDGFSGHGYCSDQPWYVGFRESLIEQRGYEGMVHPNRAGHEVTADELVDAVYLGDVPDPEAVLSLRIHAVKLEDAHPSSLPVQIVLGANGQANTVTLTERNAWVSLPAAEFRFRLPIYEAELLPRLDSDVTLHAYARLEGIEVPHPRPGDTTEEELSDYRVRELRVRRNWDEADGYGVTGGRRTIASPSSDGARLHIDYSITAEPSLSPEAAGVPADRARLPAR